MKSTPRSTSAGRERRRAAVAAAVLFATMLSSADPALAADLTVLPEWQQRAREVAQSGVPLSELAPNAPESHTVQSGDTLWDISKLFLKSPWRWPELWGMNLDQIRNPHLIFPGQVLVLVKADGRAQLKLAQPVEEGLPTSTVKLSPRTRSQALGGGGEIAAIPLHLIGPFLTEAVVLNTDELAGAARVVATQEGRVMVSRTETAYVRGDLKGAREFQLFREGRPLNDPATGELLGFEARYLGRADFVRAEGTRDGPDGKPLPVPASVALTNVREEVGVGDRLRPMPPREFISYVPHAPAGAVQGQVVSIYGDSRYAGQNQIVAINRGQRDGVERGHVLRLWRDGAMAVDTTGAKPQSIKLPDERLGMLFVFRVFDRVSYALVLAANDPVKRGDRITQP